MYARSSVCRKSIGGYYNTRFTTRTLKNKRNPHTPHILCEGYGGGTSEPEWRVSVVADRAQTGVQRFRRLFVVNRGEALRLGGLVKVPRER